MPTVRVLVIEDHRDLREHIAAALLGAGFTVEEASDGKLGLNLAMDDPPDVVVLDLGLPGLDGISLCRALRASAVRPPRVLMLTARDSLEDKIEGFEAGADDYLVKPFASEELLLRVRSLARRFRAGASQVLYLGELVIDPHARIAHRAGRALALPPKAFDILWQLGSAHPRAVTRSELIAAIWSDTGQRSEDGDALRTHIFLLRQQLDKPFAKPMLVTVHGLGFRLDVEEKTR